MKERWDQMQGQWVADNSDEVEAGQQSVVARGDTPQDATDHAETMARAAKSREDDPDHVDPEMQDHQALRRGVIFAVATAGVGMGLEQLVAAPAGASAIEPVGEMLAGGSVLYHGPYDAPDGIGGALGYGQHYAREMEDGAAEGRPGIAGVLGRAGTGQHVPDSDENQRDLDALMWKHHIDLDTAVQSSDMTTVHTQIDAHGRTLSVDTNFEARLPDNDYERHEAYDHVLNTEYAGRNDVEDTKPGMRFRSQIAAHLDAQSQDEGMSM